MVGEEPNGFFFRSDAAPDCESSSFSSLSCMIPSVQRPFTAPSSNCHKQPPIKALTPQIPALSAASALWPINPECSGSGRLKEGEHLKNTGPRALTSINEG